MNTEEFLSAILPEAGLKVLAELVPVASGSATTWRYRTFTSCRDMAETLLRLDAEGKTVYHACNSYNDWYFDTNKKRRRLRTQENIVACRSLYDDIDVGKVDGYATRRDAGHALKEFIKTSGMPNPTIVYSGAGLHVYWSLTEDIDRETWNRLAQKKRLITRHAGLLVDRAADIDVARVLRPVGATWRKTEDRTIICKFAGAPTDPVTLEAILNAYIKANDLQMPTSKSAIPAFMQGDAGNIDAHVATFPPSKLEIIAEHCQQIQMFRESGGESEPVWHAIAGIAKHCTDGERLFQEWSSTYDGYSAQETQDKFDNWSAGPSLCETFRTLNPEGCASCPHKCKTPVQLGVDTQVDVVPQIAVSEAGGATVVSSGLSTAPIEDGKFEAPRFWPQGYSYDAKHDVIYTNKVDENGVSLRVNCASPLFYVVDSVCKEDGTSMLIMESVIRGRTRQFEIETKYTADAKALKVQLAAFRIITMNQSALHDFINTYQATLRRHRDEVNTYKQLGWQDGYNSFLIGTKLILSDGVRTVRVGEHVPERLYNLGEIRGDVQTWVRGIDELYNRRNAEPYQLAICLAFGGIFGPFMPAAQWKGIPYAMTSDSSGIGKSTVCKLALNIYGNADTSMVADSTAKGMIARTSTMGNLPFLMDEVTKYVVEPKDMSDLLYALSNGTPRIGLRSDGIERAQLPVWNVPVMITGNRNILQHVRGHSVAAEATQMRVFEVDMDCYPRLPTIASGSLECRKHGAEHQKITNDILTNHYGVVGEEWIRWCIRHRAEIQAKLASVGEKLRRAMHGGDASKERYYYDLATIILVGGYFAKKLGFISFDLNNLRDWVVNHIARMRTISEEDTSTPEDLFANMMADMNGKLLVTTKYDTSDSRAQTTKEVDRGGVRGVVEGRVVTGVTGDRARVYVSIRAVMLWCAKHGVQYTKFKRDLMALNVIRTNSPGCNKSSGCVRLYIGKGVQDYEHLGRVNCLEFDYKASAAHFGTPATVTPIRETAEEAA